MSDSGHPQRDRPVVGPSERQPWMTDRDWDEFIEWHRAVAAHYEVAIEPEYEPATPPSEKGPVGS